MRYNLVLLTIVLLIVITACAPDISAVQAVSSPLAASTDEAKLRPTENQAFDPPVSSLTTQDAVYALASEEINVRSGPGVDFEVIGRLIPGQQYAVAGKAQDWFQLRVDGQPAWAFSTLVTLAGDPSTIPDVISSASQAPQTPASFADQDKAIAGIRGFLGNPDITLTFVELTLMINSPDADRQVAVFEDQFGTRYSADPSTYVLVQIEPSGLHLASGGPVSLESIRQKAHDLAEASPGFSDLRSTLKYEEGQKDGIHFFVWADTTTGWKFNRPQLQVGISDDGSLLTYMNTLIWAP